MYMRPYYGKDEGVSLPEGYSGTMLSEEPKAPPAPPPPQPPPPKVTVSAPGEGREVKVSPRDAPEKEAPVFAKAGGSPDLFGDLRQKIAHGFGILPGLGGIGELLPFLFGRGSKADESKEESNIGEHPNIGGDHKPGGEELLLLLLAALLFFGKNGDRECAVFLLLLLLF